MPHRYKQYRALKRQAHDYCKTSLLQNLDDDHLRTANSLCYHNPCIATQRAVAWLFEACVGCVRRLSRLKEHYKLSRIDLLTVAILVIALLVLLWASTSFLIALVTTVVLSISVLKSPPAVFLDLLLVLDWTYIALLIAGIFANSRTVANTLQLVDPRYSGEALKPDMRTEDCSLSRSNVARALDVYATAHFVGYAIKALIVNDRRVLWISAVLFELCEMSLAALKPAAFANLAECGWDRFVLDLVVTNFTGMELGFAIGQKYSLFQPQWSCYHILLGAAFITAVDICSFVLKAVLQIDTYSHILIVRLIFIATLSFPAARQYYLWCNGGSLGAHAVSLGATIAMEICFASAYATTKTLPM